MSDGMARLEQNIQRFESLLADLRTAVSEGHVVLKDMRTERRAIERLLGPTAKELADKALTEALEPEINAFSESLNRRSHEIYKKIGEQVDKIINLAIGKEFSTRTKDLDLRPLLANNLRVWIREILADETVRHAQEKEKSDNGVNGTSAGSGQETFER